MIDWELIETAIWFDITLIMIVIILEFRNITLSIMSKVKRRILKFKERIDIIIKALKSVKGILIIYLLVIGFSNFTTNTSADILADLIPATFIASIILVVIRLSAMKEFDI